MTPKQGVTEYMCVKHDVIRRRRHRAPPAARADLTNPGVESRMVGPVQDIFAFMRKKNTYNFA